MVYIHHVYCIALHGYIHVHVHVYDLCGQRLVVNLWSDVTLMWYMLNDGKFANSKLHQGHACVVWLDFYMWTSYLDFPYVHVHVTANITYYILCNIDFFFYLLAPSLPIHTSLPPSHPLSLSLSLSSSLPPSLPLSLSLSFSLPLIFLSPSIQISQM